MGKLYKRLECRVISATMRPHKIAHVWDLLDILCMKISRQCGVLFGHASDPDLLFHLPYHQFIEIDFIKIVHSQ